MKIQKVFHIEEELYTRFKVSCAKKEITLSRKISELIETYLKKEEGK